MTDLWEMMKVQGQEILGPPLISTSQDITDGVLVDIHSMYLHTAGTIEIVWYQLISEVSNRSI